MLGSLLHWSEALSFALLRAGIAVAGALVFHFVLFAVLRRVTRLSESTADEVVVGRLREPVRWSLVAVALSLAQEADPLIGRVWQSVARFAVPALLGWVVFALVKAFAVVMESRASDAGDLTIARSRQTRVRILSRTAAFMVVLVTVALMLLAVPGVRSVGATMIASAGLLTLVVGVAAQPALKSLIAGLQIALTEPIRIGDYVVVEEEAGRVEDIRLSYVVIRTGDERRVIIPTARFLDASFQNWTREGGGITGSVVLPVKPGCPIQPLREAYARLLAQREEWDRRNGEVQVSNALVGSIELKLVMSAADPAKLARLRLAMREAMLEWLRTEAPEALCIEP